MLPTDDSLDTFVSLESQKTGVIEEPPFKILMLGNWNGSAKSSSVADRQPIEIDRDDIDSVLRRLDARVVVPIGETTVELDFHSIDDLHPDEIFRRLPLFAELRSLRKRLLDPNGFHAAAREVRLWDDAPQMQQRETPSTTAPAADNLLDAILAKPEGGAVPPKPKPSNDLGSLINELVRPHLIDLDENEQAAMVAAVDKATGNLMRSILNSQEFKELEAAWRGLYFLVNRTETSTERKIYILDISKEELLDDVKSARDSALAKIVYDSNDPWTAFFGNYTFAPSIEDVAALIRIGKFAKDINAPFVAHISAAVLGISSLAEQAEPSLWKVDQDSNEAKLWAALRGQAEADYLAMTMPRLLARLPYGRDTEPLESFDFEEFTDSPHHNDYLWMNGSFAAALLLAQTHAEFGWGFAGRLLQDIERMPTHIYSNNGGSIVVPATEVQLSQSAAEELMERGLIPLVSFKNSDQVRLSSWQSIAEPLKMLKGNW